MEKEIQKYIDAIKEKTGIGFAIYNAKGEFIVGDDFGLNKIDADFEGIVVDEENGVTMFAGNYGDKNFVGVIKGTSVAERNYATLISALAGNSTLKDFSLSKTEFLKALLFGEVSYSQVMRYQKQFKISELPAFVMIITANTKKLGEVINLLKTYSDEKNDFIIKIEGNQLAFVKFVNENENEYQSATEYAEFMRQSVYEETGIAVNIAIGSTVKSLTDLEVSYSQAMTAVRMSSAMNSKGEVHSFKEFMAVTMLEELPKFKLNEYLSILMDNDANEIFKDQEMISTAEEFLDCSLNVSETARKLYLHRNTLTYRLDKIERTTGLNIRKFSDAVTFRLITILSQLVK